MVYRSPQEIPTEYVNGTKPRQTVNSAKWWTLPDDQAHQSLISLVNYIKDNQSYRQDQHLLYNKMYSNKNMAGLTADQYARDTSKGKLTYNVSKSCVDTVFSKIGKNKPRPMFLTEDGDYSLRRKAELLSQYMEGEFERTKVYDHGGQSCKDALIFGTGALKIFIDTNDMQIKVERVLTAELIIDDAEAMYGCPRQMHQEKQVDRDVLMEMFPKHKSKIQEANPVSQKSYTASMADNVLVTESWRLPSSSTASDGKHTIAIDGATLFSEQYNKSYFPFAFLRWNSDVIGFWGVGLCEELTGIQSEINKTIKTISKSLELMSNPRVYIESSSNVNHKDLTNSIGGIIKYTGTLPSQATPAAVNPELYQYLETLYSKAYEITGVSRLSANSQKPAGLDSGVALREYQDIESERFQIFGQQYQQFYIDIAHQMIDLSKELYDLNKKKRQKDPEYKRELEVKISHSRNSAKFIKKIKWKDVDMDEDQYELSIFPVSQLPQTPAGKLAYIQDLMKGNLIPVEEGLKLLDFPDLDSYMQRANADIDNTERILEAMIDTGTYQPPEPFMNLPLAQKITQQTYLRARCDNLSEDRLELLREFMADIQELLNPAPDPSAAPPALPPIPGGPMMPPGAPGPGMLPETLPGMPPAGLPPMPIG